MLGYARLARVDIARAPGPDQSMRWARNGVVLVLASTMCACVSLSGLTGGAGEDAGTDSRTSSHVDAHAHVDGHVTPDADVIKHDAGSPEAGSDAGTEAGACIPVAVEAGSALACPAAEAGTCSPQPVPSGSITWHPPQQQLGACTPAQVTALLDGCLGPASTMASCSTFASSDGGLACENCMITQLASGTYGTLFQDGDVLFLNIGGCIALVDPCNQACAQAEEAAELCNVASCTAVCLPANPTTADLNAFNGCTQASDTCSCNGYNNARTECADALGSSSSAGGCFATTDFFASVQRLSSLFCGTVSWDAGTTDGG